MKTILTAVMLVFLSVSSVLAETPYLERDTNSNFKIDLTKIEKPEYVEIKTDAASYRIYPSGKVEKLKWETIERGKDGNIFLYGGDSVILESTEEMLIK